MTIPLQRVPLAWTDEGSGPPLVLLHGFGAHGACWDPWLPTLHSRYRVVNVDLKGFGAAPKPRDGRYSPSDLAAHVRDLIVALDLRAVTLVGHSLGGGVALLAALRLADDAQHRLVRLVSVAGAAYPQAYPPFVRLARRPVASMLALSLIPKKWLVRRVMSEIVEVREAVTPTRVEVYAAPLRERAAQSALMRCARQIVPPDLEAMVARYPTIRVPTLCLWGREDRVVPLAIGRRLARELPNARLVVLDGCGHLPVEECPHDSLARLQEFLEATERRDETGATPAEGCKT